MRSRLAHWSSQLSDSIIRVPPWTPLPPRRRGRVARRPRARTLVHCGARRSCTHATTSHGPCSRRRRGWGAALTVGVFLTWLVSVPGPIAAQDTPPPPEAAATTPQVTIAQASLGRQPSRFAWVPRSHGPTTTVTSTAWRLHKGCSRHPAWTRAIPSRTASLLQGPIPISAPSTHI